MPRPLTIVVPYYNQPLMLARQMEEAERYPAGITVLVVDDGSKEHPAVVPPLPNVQLYRIVEDIPWNIGGAMNLAMRVSPDDWTLGLDVDHVLPAECADALLAFEADPGQWYRMGRFRVGAADDMRRKDQIATDVEFGRIHPGMNIRLMHRTKYREVGGFNEEFSGHLGGGGEFYSRCGPHAMLPDDITVHVYTTHVIPDASVRGLSRDTSHYRQRLRDPSHRRLRATRLSSQIRFDWWRVQ